MEPLITTEEGMQEYGGKLKAKLAELYRDMTENALSNATNAGYAIVFREPDGKLRREAILPTGTPTGQVIYLQIDAATRMVANSRVLNQFLDSGGRETRKQIASLLREVRYLRHPRNRQEKLANGGYVPRHSF